jgi:hypothetical protein
MRITAFFFSLSSSAALVVACGTSGSSSGSPAGTLDCNWLTGPNCYKSTFSPALGCLPDPKATGTLSADGMTCTYAGGQVITFDSPVTLPLPSTTLLGFTLSSGGTQCLKINQTSTDSFTLTTSQGTFVWTASGGAISATCPDGSSYAASGSSALQAEVCANKTTLIPTASLGRGSTSVSFGLAGTGVGASQFMSIFGCQTM